MSEATYIKCKSKDELMFYLTYAEKQGIKYVSQNGTLAADIKNLGLTLAINKKENIIYIEPND
jgi:hypothetical protein